MSLGQSGVGTVVAAAGAVVTLLAVVRLVVLGDGTGGESDASGAPPTARVDRIVAAVLLAILGLLLVAVGLLLG